MVSKTWTHDRLSDSVAATKSSIELTCSHDEISCCDVLQRFVASCVAGFKMLNVSDVTLTECISILSRLKYLPNQGGKESLVILNGFKNMDVRTHG